MTANDIMSGFDTWAKQYAEGTHATEQARSAQTQKAATAEQLSQQLSATAEKYHEGLDTYKSTLQKSKEAAQDAFADRNVAEESGPVSVGKALEMIEAEEASRKQHAANQRKFLEMNAKYARDMATTGVKLVAASAYEAGAGFMESLQDPKALLSLGGGAVAGLFLGNSQIAEDVKNGVNYIFGLENNPVGDGVDVKDLGEMTPDEYAAYLNGEANDPYDTGTGPDADGDNPVPLTKATVSDPNVDALSQSDDQLASMAQIGSSQADLVAALGLNASDLEANPDLLSAVAAFDRLMSGAPEEVNDAYTQAMQELFGKIAENDKNDPQQGQEEPDYPTA